MKDKILELIDNEIKELYRMKSNYKNDEFLTANVNARLACLSKLKNEIKSLEEN